MKGAAAAKRPRRRAAPAAAVEGALVALADPTRRAVVELLRERPHRAGELAAALGVSAPALSRHLRLLRTSGVVADDEPAEDARVRLYRLQPAALISLHDWLGDIRDAWQQQRAAFKAHAERPASPPRPRATHGPARRRRRSP